MISTLSPTAASSTQAMSSPHFCSTHAVAREPHSFPTRRSSDLPMLVGPMNFHFGFVAAGSTRSVWAATAKTLLVDPRSEEHTSELQSHSELVCRILLEKKKKEPLCGRKYAARLIKS